MKSDHKDVSDELEKLQKEMKNNAGASGAEMAKLKSQINELQAENDTLRHDLKAEKEAKDRLRDEM